MAQRERIAVILAAGKGTRLKSNLPKVLHEVAGRTMLEWILDSTRAAGCRRILVVVGHGADQVRQRVRDEDVTWVEQTEQLGTGHALAQAEAHLSADDDATLLVLNGDVPLVTSATLNQLLEAADAGWGSMAVAELEQPGGLGRVIAGEGGGLSKIVEAADASPDVLALRCINAGLYALPASQIFADLRRLDTNNAKGEYYLTDALGIAVSDGRSIALMTLENPDEALGVNSRHDLAMVHQAMLDRRCRDLMDSGVTILDPARTVIEPRVEVGADTVIHPGVSLLGTTRVGESCTIHQGSWARDSHIDNGSEIHPYSVLDGSRVGPQCNVGPFARLRPGSVMLRDSRVGNFVEMKKSQLGEGSKASHLTYLGDTTVGDGANIGAGVVTCNYDGTSKHRTEIGDGAFVGSDTMLVAPITIGRQATTGAGSVITQDVPDEALGIGRGRQRNIPDWTTRRRKK